MAGIFDNEETFLTKERDRIIQPNRGHLGISRHDNPFRALGVALKIYESRNGEGATRAKNTEKIMQNVDLQNKESLSSAIRELQKIGNIEGATQLLNYLNSVKTVKRPTDTDLNGRLRYLDGKKELVWPDLLKDKEDEDRPTDRDVNDRLRYTDGKKELVFSNLVRDKKGEKRPTATDANDRLRYLDGEKELVYEDLVVDQERQDPPKYQVTEGADGFKYYTNGPLAGHRALIDVVKEVEVDKPVPPTNAKKMMTELINDPTNPVDPFVAQGIAFKTYFEVTDDATGDKILFDKRKPNKPVTGLTKGTRERIRFETKVNEFGDDVEKAEIVTQEFNLQEIENLIFTRDAEGILQRNKEIPGYGLTGAAPEGTLTFKGKQVRQALQTMMNITLKNRSGAAVTVPEFERFKKEFSSGLFQTDKALFNAVERIRRIFNQHKLSLAAAFPNDVVRKYSEGLDFSFIATPTARKSGRLVRGEDGVWSLDE